MTPAAIVDLMMSKDKFSQWLGIERLGESAGKCKLQMLVREEMCNGFEIAHGAITYALADSALAFASNSHGRKSVSIETSISHIYPVRTGDVLTAVAEEKNLANRLAIYEVTITNQESQTVALFKGTVFRKEETWQSKS
jgi:acyl-CoA thioesterase